MSIDRWMDKADAVDIFKTTSLRQRKNEIMPSAVTRMDPERIILRDVRERQIS